MTYNDYFTGEYSKRKVNRFIRGYYTHIALRAISVGIITEIPRLEFTKAKKYYGCITWDTEGRVIRISDQNLLNPYCDYNDFMFELTRTICHELAHLVVWEHGEAHDAVTEKIILTLAKGLYFEEPKEGDSVA